MPCKTECTFRMYCPSHFSGKIIITAKVPKFPGKRLLFYFIFTFKEVTNQYSEVFIYDQTRNKKRNVLQSIVT